MEYICLVTLISVRAELVQKVSEKDGAQHLENIPYLGKRTDDERQKLYGAQADFCPSVAFGHHYVYIFFSSTLLPRT